jgi:hypothetical protein
MKKVKNNLIKIYLFFKSSLDEDDDDEILSSSTTGHLWKSAFGPRGGAQFLDICLLKKAYMKTLEEMSDEEQDTETVSSIVNTIVDKIDEQDNDEIGLAERIGKRSLTTSTVNLESNTQRMKRLRSNTANSNISI